MLMKTTHDEGAWQPWKPWQQKLIGFGLAWWLCAIPTVIRLIWPALMSGKMPASLSQLLDLAPAWLFLGAVLALAALSTDFREHTVAQRLARWFLLGLCTLLVLLALT